MLRVIVSAFLLLIQNIPKVMKNIKRDIKRWYVHDQNNIWWRGKIELKFLRWFLNSPCVYITVGTVEYVSIHADTLSQGLTVYSISTPHYMENGSWDGA